MKRSVSTITFSLAILVRLRERVPTASRSHLLSAPAAVVWTRRRWRRRLPHPRNLVADGDDRGHRGGGALPAPRVRKQALPTATSALPTQGKVASISAGALLEEHRLFAPSVSSAGPTAARGISWWSALQRALTSLFCSLCRVLGEHWIAAEPSKVGSATLAVAVTRPVSRRLSISSTWSTCAFHSARLVGVPLPRCRPGIRPRRISLIQA